MVCEFELNSPKAWFGGGNICVS